MTQIAVVVWSIFVLLLPPTWHGVLYQEEQQIVVRFQGGRPLEVKTFNVADQVVADAVSAEDVVALFELATP